jgi:xanthine dehydrogenase YagR molybdenum-binding subunit
MSVIGRALDRIEGRAKVTGRARYSGEQSIANVAHAALVTSTVAKGRIVSMETRDAERAPGVLAVLTHRNAPRLARSPDDTSDGSNALDLLQRGVVRYANQPIGVVVAQTLEEAHEAAVLVEARYAVEPHEVLLEPRLGEAAPPGDDDPPAASSRGDVEGRLRDPEIRIEQVYRTPFETHSPMEPHATLAVWDGPKSLTLYDATQGIFDCRDRVAELLGLSLDDVRVVSEYLGGGFGSKGPTWSHVVLAAMAARHVQRPVKLVLRRPQMFGPVGFRSQTRQAIVLGAMRDGTLTALRHDTVMHTSSFDEFVETAGLPARMLYACANAATSHRLVRSDIGTPSYMRAPGWAPGTFALECALDEMAEAVDMDPVQFRLKNYAEVDPEAGRPWSSKALRECYQLGAERFGWGRRPGRPGSLRDGHARVGWGMASSVYPTHRSAAGARATLRADGTLLVESGTQDLGTGTYTVMLQVAADALGLPPQRVEFRLGDTDFPQTPVSGGSMTAASVGPAVLAAVFALRDKLIDLAIHDARSPVADARAADVVVDDGRVFPRDDPSRGETLRALLARQRVAEVEALGEAEPGDEAERYAMYAFGAQFAEVRVDADLGQLRVTRLVGVFDVGRVLNAKTARSQLLGGMVGGIGMALHEHTVMDDRLGRFVNANLADYHVPVNADVPAIDVAWIEGAADPYANPLGVKGIGELGITGTAAAIANAVYHATGRRIRDLPITLDRLL